MNSGRSNSRCEMILNLLNWFDGKIKQHSHHHLRSHRSHRSHLGNQTGRGGTWRDHGLPFYIFSFFYFPNETGETGETGETKIKQKKKI